jgi:hypothetical protein
MLETLFTNTAHARRHLRWPLHNALRWLAPEKVQGLSLRSTASPQHFGFGDDTLPAIVTKAQDDVRCRQALARLGYSKVRSDYARHKREERGTFVGLDHEHLWPTGDFVRDWLKEERQRIVVRVRWSFLVTMLATIVAGLAFVAATAILG